MAKSNAGSEWTRSTHSRLNIEVPTDLYEAFRDTATAEHRTMTSAMRMLMQHYVDNVPTRKRATPRKKPVRP